MEDYVLFENSLDLGFSRSYVLGKDFELISLVKSKKDLNLQVKNAKKKGLIVVFRPSSEELLRYALEKTLVDIVVGVEKIHYKDSVHYLRSGLDQILCKIAHTEGKRVMFAFCDVLNSKDRGRLLGRMMMNIKLCKKYKVEMVFCSLAKDKYGLRYYLDLKNFWKNLSVCIKKV